MSHDTRLSLEQKSRGQLQTQQKRLKRRKYNRFAYHLNQ